jgi:hypothetical protein
LGFASGTVSCANNLVLHERLRLPVWLIILSCEEAIKCPLLRHLFAVLFVGGFWLIGLFVEHPVPVANWITGFVAFIVTFTYYAVQVPDKIRVARMCAMKPLFAEFAKAQGMKAALKTRH